jgi:uncharacterized alpha-E superfamily protein
LLARIAHELFWLGRSLARAEHTARMLDGVFQAELQGRPDVPLGVDLSWEALLVIMGSPRPEDELPVNRDAVLYRLTLDPANQASILCCVQSARRGARAARDVISSEMWEAVNTFHLELLADDLALRLRTVPYGLYALVKQRCALFWGLAAREMLRDDAHAFLSVGGGFESADMVLRMLRVALPPLKDIEEEEGAQTLSDGQALALLHAVGAFQAFRRSVPAPPNALPVARFLLFERDYPDSVAASIDAVLRALEAADASPRQSPPVLRLNRLSADLEFRRRMVSNARDLGTTLTAVQHELGQIDQDIADRYFAGASSDRLILAAS